MYYFWISTRLLGARYRIAASNVDAAKRIANGIYAKVKNRPPVLVFDSNGEIVATV